MRDRYANARNFGSAKIPSVLYYDRGGNFCGIENGMDFQDDDAYLKLRWCETSIRPPAQPVTTHQVEVVDFAHGAICGDEEADERATPKGKNHR